MALYILLASRHFSIYIKGKKHGNEITNLPFQKKERERTNLRAPLGGLSTDGSGSVLQCRGTVRHCSTELKRTSSALTVNCGRSEAVELGKVGFTGSVLQRRYSVLQ